MRIEDLPTLNASLNALASVFLLFGWWFIRTDRKTQHIAMMVGALVTSTAFLVSYLTYHFHVPPKEFTEQGIVRPIYFVILISHIILAAVALPMVIMTVVPALRSRFDRHRRLARWTLPVWLYVSVTGVLVYFFLYHWYPPVAAPVVAPLAGS